MNLFKVECVYKSEMRKKEKEMNKRDKIILTVLTAICSPLVYAVLLFLL